MQEKALYMYYYENENIDDRGLSEIHASQLCAIACVVKITKLKYA